MGKPTWARMEQLSRALQNRHDVKSGSGLVGVCGVTTRSVRMEGQR